MNELFKKGDDNTESLPIQSNLIEPDVWWKDHISIKEDFHPISIKPFIWKHKTKLLRRKRKYMVVERKIQDFNGSTLLYLVKSRKIKLDLNKKYLLIPFKIDNLISFVPITTKQYDELLMSYNKFGSLTINEYREKI